MWLRYRRSCIRVKTVERTSLKRCAAAALVLLFLLLHTACSVTQDPPLSALPEKEETKPLSWYICVPGTADGETFFEETNIGRLLADRLPEEPRLCFFNGDATTEFSRLYASGQLPDLFTVEAADNVVQLCRKRTYTYAVEEVQSSIVEMIPTTAQHLFESIGGGHGVPGGVSASSSVPRLSEGVYVRRRLLDTDGALSTADFLRLAERTMVRETASSLTKEQFNPVLLDMDNQPFRTLEHLFGISPIYSGKNGPAHRIFDEDWLPLLRFLSEFGNATQHMPLRRSQDMVQSLLSSDVQLYIGRHEPVSYANLQLAEAEQFVPVQAAFSEDGFLESYSQQGQYLTFFCRNGLDNGQRAAACVQALLTEEMGRLAVLGEQDRNWIYDGSGGGVVPLMNESEITALQQGILRFPYLSTAGLGVKGYSLPIQALDILATPNYENLYDDEVEGVYHYLLESKVQSLLVELMEKESWDEEDLHRSLEQLRRSEELMYLDVGLP